MGKAEDAENTSLLFGEVAAASIATPAADFRRLFVDTDGLFKYKDEAGAVTSLGGLTAASQVEMEAGTEAALRSVSPLRVAQAITALGGAGGSPAWHGNLYGAYGDCDPLAMLLAAQTHGTIAATPTNVSTTVARIAYFRPPAAITVDKIRGFCVTATSLFRLAIYNADTLARLTAELTPTTAGSTWVSAGDNLNLALTAGQLYFIAVSATTTSTNAGFLGIGPTISSGVGYIPILPKSFPGNLDLDAGFLDGAFAQFAVTAGALPDPAATIEEMAGWTGGFPMLFLDASNA